MTKSSNFDTQADDIILSWKVHPDKSGQVMTRKK